MVLCALCVGGPALGQRIYKFHSWSSFWSSNTQHHLSRTYVATRDRWVTPATCVDQHLRVLWELSCKMARLWWSCMHCVWGGPCIGSKDLQVTQHQRQMSQACYRCRPVFTRLVEIELWDGWTLMVLCALCVGGYRGYSMLVSINMYANTHCEVTKNQASECVLSRILICTCMFPPR